MWVWVFPNHECKKSLSKSRGEASSLDWSIPRFSKKFHNSISYDIFKSPDFWDFFNNSCIEIISYKTWSPLEQVQRVQLHLSWGQQSCLEALSLEILAYTYCPVYISNSHRVNRVTLPLRNGPKKWMLFSIAMVGSSKKSRSSFSKNVWTFEI